MGDANIGIEQGVVIEQLRQVSGGYFVNESNVKLAKYYDSLGGENNVAQPSWRSFGGFFIIEKI
ncbi:hypothetical protein HYU95_04435 [Candidatus Daviesbacteria bacterium]|nr:hypothetical protein [Candidatus Daviesbacteria bacterium]